MRRGIVSFITGYLLLSFLSLSVAAAGIISTKQEISIGRQAAQEVEKQYKLVDDPALQARIQLIGLKLAAVSDRPGLPYAFKVLDADEVNAFALPGGFIYVFKGLTDYMVTDDELAGIISHEIGHAVKRHSMAQLEKTLGTAVLLGCAFGPKGLDVQLVALQAITAGYSREDERMADRLGFEQAVKAGYNPYGMLVGLQKLERLHPDYQTDLFSDHPDSQQRVHLMEDCLKKAGIRPNAWEENKVAFVGEGVWAMPSFRSEESGLSPLMRAYFLAGRLYRLTQLQEYSPEHYILDSNGRDISVYYEDQFIMTLTERDAVAANLPLAELSQVYVKALQAWNPKDLLRQQTIMADKK